MTMENSFHSQENGPVVDGSDSNEWGTMGGTPGDGSSFVGSPEPPSPPMMSGTTPSPQMQSQSGGGGGITRFATPEMAQQQHPGSFAARSAQSYESYYTQQQPANNITSAPQRWDANSGDSVPAPAGSYASLSQQAFQQQQPVYMGNAPYGATGGVTGHSLQHPQPTASGRYAARSAQAYQQNNSHQPQNPPTAAVSVITSSPSPAPVNNPGSFAARSAQAYAQQQSQAYNTPQPHGPTPYNTPNMFPQLTTNVTSPAQMQFQQPITTFSPQSSQPQPSNVYSPQPNFQQPSNTYTQGQLNQSHHHQQQQQQQPAPVSQVANIPDNYSTVSSMPSLAHSQQRLQDPQLLQQQMQQRLLSDATRKVQEHAYYMKQAMEQKNLSVVLDRASYLMGELGGPPHGPHHHHNNNNNSSNGSGPMNTGNAAKLNPKNYYELYMRVLEEIPAFEDYLLSLVKQPLTASDATIQIVDTVQQTVARMTPYTMRELYDCTQYCPRVVSRLYIQIAAGSALIRSGEFGAKWVMRDLQQVVRCEQNPVRGLFLRHYLLTALRDKLPDSPAPITGEPHLATILDDEELEGIVENEALSETDPGTVKDSFEFILDNLKEMNKLWVRIQHLPGEGRNKDVRKRRERERNDLRMIVGTNLVRLSQLESVTSKVYGDYILPQVLEHIVFFGDPLSQAYIMDCLVQAFPDEYHIETMPIILNVCPRLRDKVNIRTILQGLMDRLANYLADEELLDETDTNQVKRALARDSFSLFEDCINKVYNARGPKLTSKEVIRLQTALLMFSLRCFPGRMEQVSRCLGGCSTALRQANVSYDIPEGTMATVPDDGKLHLKDLDEVSIIELERLLSIPLESLGMKVLELDHYSELIAFLPWENRREVAMNMLRAVDNLGYVPKSVNEIDQLFNVVEPVLMSQLPGEMPTQGSALVHASNLMSGLGIAGSPPKFHAVHSEDSGRASQLNKEIAAVSKLVYLLNHENTDVLFEMLGLAKKHICKGETFRTSRALVSILFASVRLAERVFELENIQQASELERADMSEPGNDNTLEVGMQGSTVGVETEASTGELASGRLISCRAILLFAQATIDTIGDSDGEGATKLCLELCLVADSFCTRAIATKSVTDYSSIAYEFLSQAFTRYEDSITDSKAQYRCIRLMIGTLLASRKFSKEEYEGLITRVTQFSAKVLKKNDQCELVTRCALLFYPVDPGMRETYSNPQRALECLQRALKLADACTSGNPANAYLFVDLLEIYVRFFECKNPSISPAYITGLVALVKEHTSNLQGDSRSGFDIKTHFSELVKYIEVKLAITN